MMRATDLAHLLVRRVLGAGDWAVDATAGNGHDTAFLAECVGPSGRVFGFDIQEAALAKTALRVEGLAQVTLVHAGHETLSARLPAEARRRLAAVMFNLGYLPGGTKTVVTRPATTLAALDQALDNLRAGGLVTLVLYPGHPGGGDEAEAVRSHVANLEQPFSVTHHVAINARRPAPELLVIERSP